MRRSAFQATLVSTLLLLLGSSAMAAVLRVKADAPEAGQEGVAWGAAFPTISSALGVATPGDAVWGADVSTADRKRIRVPTDVRAHGGLPGSRAPRGVATHRASLGIFMRGQGEYGPLLRFAEDTGPAMEFDDELRALSGAIVAARRLDTRSLDAIFSGFHTNPLPWNLAYGDLHMALDSRRDETLIESGNAGADDRPRLEGLRADIGTDESDGSAGDGIKRIFHIRPDGDDRADGLTWQTAWRTPTAVFSRTRGEDEVWIAAGEYVPNPQPAGSALPVITIPRGVSVFGGFAGHETDRTQRDPERHVTVLDANQDPYAVMTTAGGTDYAILDGFTVRNTGGSPNQSAGIYASYLRIRRCVLTSNRYAAAILSWDSVLEECSIVDNAGTGVLALQGTVTVRRSLVARNGGGIGAGAYGRLVAENNRVIDNHAPAQPFPTADPYIAGIFGRNGSLIRNNVVAGNTGAGPGIAVMSSPSGIAPSVVVNNTVAGNSGGPFDGGLTVSRIDGSPPEVVNNIVAFNSVGVNAPDRYATTIRNNCIFGNALADYVHADLTGTAGNVSVDPRLASLTYGDFHIQPDSPCMDAGEDGLMAPEDTDAYGQPRIQGARVDIGADESDGTRWEVARPVIRVRPDGSDMGDGATWGTAKASIGAAVEAVNAAGGGEIWIAGGTYPGPVELGPHTSLYGGFSGAEREVSERDFSAETVLEGSGSGPVLKLPACILGLVEGFTVRNGEVGVDASGAKVTLRRLRVSGNGAGILGKGGLLVVEDSDISDNAGVGVGMAAGVLTVRRSVIAHNVSPPGVLAAGGVQGGGAGVVVVDSRIHGNAPRGVDIVMGVASVERCRIEDNGGTGDGGGILFTMDAYWVDRDQPRFSATGNRISGNRAARGGGVAVRKWQVSLSRNVITGNAVTSHGAGIAFLTPDYRARPVLNGNVIADNTGPSTVEAVYTDYNPSLQTTLTNNTVAGHPDGLSISGALLASNNIVAGNGRAGRDLYPGNNCVWNTRDLRPVYPRTNITADPRFMNPAAGDYSLQADSPCIDAGDDTVVLPGDRDVEGKPRIFGEHVDIGAYEFVPPDPDLFSDALRALRLAAGLETATSEDVTRLDTDASASLDLPDATRLLRRAVGMDIP